MMEKERMQKQVPGEKEAPEPAPPEKIIITKEAEPGGPGQAPPQLPP